MDVTLIGKNVSALFLSRARTPIVVNSFGRSGSTVLTDAITASASRASEWGARHVVRGEAWRLESSRLVSGRCYKSHDYPTSSVPANTKILYVFGDPLEATRSLIAKATREGAGWMRAHCDHLGVPAATVAEVLSDDVLRVESHLSAWLAYDHSPAAFIRYEEMWSMSEMLSDFLGFRITLPERRDRSPKSLSERDEARLASTYSSAASLVDSLPSWQART